MRQLLLLCCLALAASGCTLATISTELDPGGPPKYRMPVGGTGTNIARRFDARDVPSTRVLDRDDVERMLRPPVVGVKAGGAN